jgi:hypothetical protein
MGDRLAMEIHTMNDTTYLDYIYNLAVTRFLSALNWELSLADEYEHNYHGPRAIDSLIAARDSEIAEFEKLFAYHQTESRS